MGILDKINQKIAMLNAKIMEKMIMKQMEKSVKRFEKKDFSEIAEINIEKTEKKQE